MSRTSVHVGECEVPQFFSLAESVANSRDVYIVAHFVRKVTRRVQLFEVCVKASCVRHNFKASFGRKGFGYRKELPL